jgi:hypothetical protein
MNDFTYTQKILEGCLLGDGHLELHKNGKNASFKYLSSSKQHTEYIHQFFLEYCNENNRVIVKKEIFDNRTKKTYINYSFRTKSLSVFTEQYLRFYANKIKIVPLDIEINKNLLLMWYIGDGELEKKYGYIKLHTNSFTYDEIIFLCEKLSDFDAKPLRKTDTQYLINIPRKKVNNFLKYIGKCPISDYKHKWKEIPYKNKNIEINGINYYKNLYPILKNDFLSGKYTIYGLHKKYNIPITAIKNYFTKNNVNWNSINNEKKIIQYDINNNIIKEWNSGQEIVKTLNYNATGISECCRGIRKQYKSFIWKFK